jgi:hypothetical protein
MNLRIAVVAAVTLTGCPGPGYEWTKPGTPQAEIDRDAEDCERKTGGGTYAGGAGTPMKFIERCMVERGYKKHVY